LAKRSTVRPSQEPTRDELVDALADIERLRAIVLRWSRQATGDELDTRQFMQSSSTAEPAVVRKYVKIPVWCSMTDTSRRKTYDLLGRGALKAIKVGTATLIDVEHGLAFLRSLPPAEFASPRRKAELQRQAERREQRNRSA
jgi:hypothetical protein